MTPFTWHNEQFILHHERCMYWEKEQILILSDLHLGKSGHFRKEGIAIPQQVYQNDLNRLFALIVFFKPKEVMLVGDLFHSRANKEWDWFSKLRNDFPAIEFTLVLGNHDKLPGGIAEEMHLNVTQMVRKTPFLFLHNAEEKNDNPSEGFICGHIHPAVQVPTGTRQKIRLPCFHFTANTCTLPAFSLFTGNHTIQPKASEAVFAITSDAVIRM